MRAFLFVLLILFWGEISAENLALHKKYQLDPQPNYPLCTGQTENFPGKFIPSGYMEAVWAGNILISRSKLPFPCSIRNKNLFIRSKEMAEFATNGKANAALTTGIIGTALGVLGGGMSLLGGMGNCGCSDNVAVNRYELNMENQLVQKDMENALLRSNIYTDQKITDAYERLANRISSVEAQVNSQAVYNATVNATLGCIQSQVSQLQGLTKLVVPATSVCPTPMPAYNSWTAPTSSSSTTPAA